MNKLISAAIILVFAFTSCATTNHDIGHSYPQSGQTNNAAIAVKDYESRGIIIVKSTEVIDALGNRSGSKITYEMLMLEAQRLNADDVINVRIDVNQVDEIIKSRDGSNVQKITYNYTATALAIKYTNAVQQAQTTGSIQEISGDLNLPSSAAAKANNRKPFIRALTIAGGLALAGIVIGIIASSANNYPYYYYSY